MAGVFGQEPGVSGQGLAQQPDPTAIPPAGAPAGGIDGGIGFVQQLELLGWVDRTALAVLAVFFVIGLFKGLVWQVSRVAILIVAYLVAGRFGAPLGRLLARAPDPAAAPDPGAAGAAAAAPLVADAPETMLYLAYVLLFLAVLVVLSLLAMLVQKFVDKAGLGFFDRLGGGVVGVGTGACIVLFLLSVVHMFFRGSQLAVAAESSHALRLARRTVDWLGTQVDDNLRHVFDLAPLAASAEAPDGPPARPATPGAEPAAADGTSGTPRDAHASTSGVR
jgi:uncharacterized membrane protein required for colicin V production